MKTLTTPLTLYIEQITMDTRLVGNVTLNCSECHAEYFFDASDLAFEKNLSADTGIDLLVNYVAKLRHPCIRCDAQLAIDFDVWEKPAGVTNGIYSDERHVEKVSCEFDISYYDHSDNEIASYDENDTDEDIDDND